MQAGKLLFCRYKAFSTVTLTSRKVAIQAGARATIDAGGLPGANPPIGQ
jgi:hypothetical protein